MPLFQKWEKKIDADKNDKTVKDLINLLYETSMLQSGFTLNDPSNFATRIHRMIKLGLSIDPDEDNETNATGTEELKMPKLEEAEESRMEDVD